MRWRPGIVALALSTLAIACDPSPPLPPPALPDADPQRGKQAIVDYGCGACHAIPGIRQADSYIAPPLDRWARRSFIAGEIPNTADNLIAWIENPQQIRPGTAMPDLGVTHAEARAIAAYLLTLD